MLIWPVQCDCKPAGVNPYITHRYPQLTTCHRNPRQYPLLSGVFFGSPLPPNGKPAGFPSVYPIGKPACETLCETHPKIHKIIGGLLALYRVPPVSLAPRAHWDFFLLTLSDGLLRSPFGTPSAHPFWAFSGCYTRPTYLPKVY